MRTPLIRRLAYSCSLYALWAATASAATPSEPATGWQACSAVQDGQERLACFDQWAAAQHGGAVPASKAAVPAASALTVPESPSEPAPVAVAEGAAMQLPGSDCYRSGASTMLQFYELRRATDCGTFKLRGFQPQSVSVTAANHMNTSPSTPTQPAFETDDYQTKELRIQLSLRTKLAAGLLTPEDSDRLDSLWVGYTQLSFWQIFNADVSRPFRTTDHQPEIFYVYPTEAQLPLGWRLRYSGIGLVHHSNGQSDPLSRSWNRAYLMAGAELNDRWQLQLKAWHRISEKLENDDNPGIQNYWGRGEVKLFWQPDARNIFGLTARGSLGKGYGSGRLEWMHALGGDNSNLRLHVQLFSGYGESLIDYNYKRTSLSVGLSLLDF